MLLVNAFRFIGQHADMLLSRAGSQLLLSAAALGVALAVSLPIGLVTGHLRRWSAIAIGGANMLRALPTLAIVAVGLGLYGFGFVNIMIALSILGIPPILNNTYVAISSVPKATVDAGRGLGMRPWQLLFQVEVPNAVPLILGGIRTASVYIIATAYLASFAGIDGTLGTVITNEGAFGLAGVLGATIVIVVLAFVVEGLLALCQHLLTPQGLRARVRTGSQGAPR